MGALKSWLCGAVLAAGLAVAAAGLVGCGPEAERGPAMTMEEACRPVYPKEDRGVARTRRALKKPIDVAFDMVPLDKALKVISEKTGIAIILEPDLASKGIDLSSQLMHFAVTSVPADEVLDLVLWDDLAYVVEADRVLVTGRDAALQMFCAVYPVADLARSPGSFSCLAGWLRGWEDLVYLLERNVNNIADPSVAAWTDEGGPAAADFLGGALIVTQTRRGHERILNLLTMLRKARAQEGPPQPVSMPEPRGVRRIRRRLEERVDVDFENTTLLAALDFLRDSLKDVNFVVDPGLDAVGLDLSCRVITLKWKQAPINEVLATVLGRDLGYRICPHYVLLTTRDRLCRDLPIVMYPIRDIQKEDILTETGAVFADDNIPLVPEERVSDVNDPSGVFDDSSLDEPAGASAALFGGGEEKDEFAVGWQEVADAIKRTVSYGANAEVATWSDEGGPAAIDYYDGVLIITQTPEGHERVAELLTLLCEGLARVERQLAE